MTPFPLIVYDAMIDDERRQNAFGLLMSLNMLIETPAGFDYTGADCRGWMGETGFRDVQIVPLQGTVPAERMKAGVLHRVPLSHAALAILRPLHEARASEFVFPGLRGQLNRTVMRKLLERRMNASVATVHGFRSAFRDWAAETTRFPREVAELV